MVTRFHGDERGSYTIEAVGGLALLIIPVVLALFVGQEMLGDLFEETLRLASLPFP